MKKKTILLALGGNAILQPGQEATYEAQLTNVCASAEFLADLVEQGHKLVLTHGNGPQVGNLLRQNEEAAGTVPPMPLHILNAQSQGFIGYMLQQCVQAALARRGVRRQVACLMTRTLVDENDEAFNAPSKPVGLFYSAEEARELASARHWDMKEDAGRGWRRVVPSPRPKAVIEIDAVHRLVEENFVTISCGGGGIPVIPNPNGGYIGVEAVVDKDLSGALLAESLEADMFLIVTDVENVYVGYGTPAQQVIGEVGPEEMREHLASGEFSKGSMGPKVEAALAFVEATGNPAVICALSKIDEAVAGTSGTRIVAGSAWQGSARQPGGAACSPGISRRTP